MRISDWSSDVCSSDLRVGVEGLAQHRKASSARPRQRAGKGARAPELVQDQMRDAAGIAVAVLFVLDLGRLDDEGLQQWRHDEHGGAFREAMTGVVGDPEASEFRPDQRSDLVMQAYRQPQGRLRRDQEAAPT